MPFTPDDPGMMNAVMANAAGLRGVPHMLRTGHERPVISDLNMASLGFDIVGQVEGATPFDSGRGAAAAPKLPARLVY
ncbi:hypothetical protein ABY45_16375 [Microbacterium maritypicum]|uniref:hypothetical protein n=1 Tax=Microbacterium maritypicum TaxID=33918 RepID=UPI003D6DB761